MQSNQFKKWGRCPGLALPVFILLVSGCGTMGQMDTNGKTPGEFGTESFIPVLPLDHESKAVTPMKLTMTTKKEINDEVVIKAKDINVLLETGSQLELGIKDLADNDSNHGMNLKQLISQMRASNKNSDKNAPGFTGINGALALEVLRVIDDEALAPAGSYDTKKSVVVSMEGQIVHYKFIHDPDGDPDAPTQGNGELIVIVAVSSRTYLPNGRVSPKVKTVGYKWDIKVLENAFKVIKHSGDRDDPFDVEMTFSEGMKDRIEDLDFKVKLWAKGTDIDVVSVWRDENFKWSRPQWKLLTKTQEGGKWARLYESDTESCIDMMFASDYPPNDLTGLGAPPFYCLGRCDHPGIVNSR